jgi:hypothetical protein
VDVILDSSLDTKEDAKLVISSYITILHQENIDNF